MRRPCSRVLELLLLTTSASGAILTEYGLLPINVSTLVPTAALGMDLYQISEATQRPVLFLGGNYPLEQTDLERLRVKGTDRLYISLEHRDDYQAYLREVALGTMPRTLSRSGLAS